MKRINTSLAIFIACNLLVALGCSEDSTVVATQSTEEVNTDQASLNAQPAPQPPAPPPPPQPQQTEQVVAKAGVGKKGQGLKDGGLITTHIKAMRTTEQRLHYMNIAKTLQIYNAINGKPPQTTEAFMKEIIKKNNLPLPELPAGQRYVFDPNQKDAEFFNVQGVLLVERPVDAAGNQ